MTIQRQYVLPNCSLILEGLSNNGTSDVLSLLANAECKFVGIEQPISGGLVFFQSLVETISQYTQALLSGLPHPPAKTEAPIVQLKPGEGPYHHLIVQPEPLPNATSNAEPNPGTALADDIKLSTVQLFDLAEAIDQFFADTQTLPDLKLQLAPLSRRFVRPSEPLAQRATPPLLGLGALAIAAAGLFWLPIPEIPEPRPETAQSSLSPETPETPTTTPENPPPESASPADGSRSVITDPDQIAALQGQLQGELDRALLIEPLALEDALTYQVSVAENGDIIGYKPENDVALASIDQTPLPGLTYLPLEPDTEQINEPVAQFQVVFNPDGSAAVLSPTDEAPSSSLETSNEAEANEAEANEAEANEAEANEAEANKAETIEAPVAEPAAPEPTDTSPDTAPNTRQPEVGQLSRRIENRIESADQIATLNTQLRRDIIENRDRREFGETLEYRVRLAEDGTIVGYEAHNDAGETYVDETPLPELTQSANPDLPQTDFLVVVTEGGIVQVSPWSGWN
ncbi:MAG: DUF4335 domain-containing protein [Cyanobacteria bacterium P01_F01_bin.4]